MESEQALVVAGGSQALEMERVLSVGEQEATARSGDTDSGGGAVMIPAQQRPTSRIERGLMTKGERHKLTAAPSVVAGSSWSVSLLP